MRNGRSLLMVGYGIKMFHHERDLFILTGGMRDGLKIDCGIRDENQPKITGYECYAKNCH